MLVHADRFLVDPSTFEVASNDYPVAKGTEKIVEEDIPLHRLGTPDEVAKIIYVLCTEMSSYVNGAEIHINGGQHV